MFRLLIDYAVVVFIEGLPQEARRMIRDRLREIRAHSAHRSNYTEPEVNDGPVELNICGSFAIKCWVDHADRQIQVLAIYPAERRR